MWDDLPVTPPPPRSANGNPGRVSEAVGYCCQPQHLRRTVRIALVVGLLLTAINQGDVIAGGEATPGTWLKCAMNFMVPFVVSNLGLLSGRRS